jgi:hypothetical protein
MTIGKRYRDPPSPFSSAETRPRGCVWWDKEDGMFGWWWVGNQRGNAGRGRTPRGGIRSRLALLCAVGLFALAAAFLPAPAIQAAGAPMLTLDPSGGRCDTLNPPLTVRGAGFPAGITVELINVPAQDNSHGIGARSGSATVAADGTFVVETQLWGCGFGMPQGSQFIMYAFDTAHHTGGFDSALASATFTVSYVPPPVAPGEKECFTETGHCIAGRFLAYWRFWGGLPRFGYPLTDESAATLEDGNTYTVQYFERDRLEYHPENQPPYDMLLGQLGRHVHPADPPVDQLYATGKEPIGYSPAYFTATGHNVRGAFRVYYDAHGGLMQFGLPITEEFKEAIGGQEYTVQYFERARFEYHPENQPPYDVLLGQLGRRVLAETAR